ncbi:MULTISPECIES: IclR family transcriptional regulator [unclassified Mesorhizobium]|uniref:IclR family transcriptional regulator n=1 Tax=unclassified Mesorhizobium TaxID=325217 RepID=UPI001FE2113E|nr:MULTISPECIES: IclR family transcriptional regulator [unclassified Mesorhizobium]
MTEPSQNLTEKVRFDAVDRTMAILRVLEKAEGPLSLSAIAREVDLGKPTTLRYLASLVGHGVIERVDGNGYTLGIDLFMLGQKALHRRDIRAVARPYLQKLYEHFNETINLALLVRQEVVVVDSIETTQMLRQGGAVGSVNPWHASSLSKSILAWLDRGEANRLLQRCSFDRYTPRTLTSAAKVLAELPEIVELGYAVDNEEATIGSRCVGAAIFDASGRPIGAISISGPTTRVVDDAIPSVGAHLVEVTAQLSRAIGFPGRRDSRVGA